MMLDPQSTGGSPVTSCMSAHKACESARCCASGRAAMNSSTTTLLGRVTCSRLRTICPSCINKVWRWADLAALTDLGVRTTSGRRQWHQVDNALADPEGGEFCGFTEPYTG